MLRLAEETAPFWIALPHGVKVKVRPLTYPVNEAALSSARSVIRRLVESADEVEEAGGTVEGLPDLDTEDGRNGYFQFVYVEALANASILEWDGVGDQDGKPVEPAPQAIHQLMLLHNVAEAFIDRYTANISRVHAEGNA